MINCRFLDPVQDYALIEKACFSYNNRPYSPKTIDKDRLGNPIHNYVGAFKDGFFIGFGILIQSVKYPTVQEGHIVFMPESFGKSKRVLKAIINFVWLYTNTDTILAPISISNTLAIRLVEYCGFQKAYSIGIPEGQKEEMFVYCLHLV